jgi:hypothetical protein
MDSDLNEGAMDIAEHRLSRSSRTEATRVRNIEELYGRQK